MLPENYPHPAMLYNIKPNTPRWRGEQILPPAYLPNQKAQTALCSQGGDGSFSTTSTFKIALFFLRNVTCRAKCQNMAMCFRIIFAQTTGPLTIRQSAHDCKCHHSASQAALQELHHGTARTNTCLAGTRANSELGVKTRPGLSHS